MQSVSEGYEAHYDLTTLAAACRRETEHYRHKRKSDTRYCLEIFRRALRRSTTFPAHAYEDEDARNLLTEIYSEFIRANLNRSALRYTSFDDLVQQTWLRFWQAAERGLAFESLEAALSYLRLTTVSAVMEAKRQEIRELRDLSLTELAACSHASDGGEGEAELATDSPDPVAEAAIYARFRARCRELLKTPDPLVYRIFSLRYALCLPPKMIASQLAQEGVLIRQRRPTPRLVSDLLEQAMRRLAADPEIRDLLRVRHTQCAGQNQPDLQRGGGRLPERRAL